MANLEHLKILRQRVSVWNQWRDEHREIRPDFERVHPNKANLAETDFSGADFSGAALNNANLKNANLSEINLRGAWLHRANCYRADLSRAYLVQTNLIGVHLTHAHPGGAIVGLTQFSDGDFTRWKEYDAYQHAFRQLLRSLKPKGS